VSAKVPEDPAKRKVSVDRLLEAVGPHFSIELDRMLEEFRATLEAEANVRLKKALLDKEVEYRARAAEDEERIREETGQTVRAEVTAELEARFKDHLAGELDGLKQTLQNEAREASQQWKQERLELIAEAESWRLMADFHRRVGDAASQTEILRRFLVTAEHLSEGVAIYLNKPDGLALWNAQGDTIFPDLVSEDTIDPEWFFTPIVVQSKTIAAVCALGITDRDAFGIITDALKRAIENFGLRIRFFGRRGASESDVVDRALETSDSGENDGADLSADARRLARMLVSEIKLGHEKQVLEGRVHADLYSRLQKEIDTGRETYRRQVEELDSDYFHEELVKIFAENDSQRLGEDYPGPGGL
jgi:hypothetical protein